MRLFKFWNADGVEKEKEDISLKKAVRSVQGDFKDKIIGVEYVTKKGKSITTSVEIPIGRKIRQALIAENEKKRLKELKEAR